jgi:iron complex transport system substrate-binding protein
LQADPDLLVLPQASAQRLTQRPGWRHLAAVQQVRVCRYTPSEGDALVRPGPRMVEGARWMARCLREVWG